MTSRRSPLADETKAVLAVRLSHGKEAAARALEDFHVDVHLANAMGMTIAEIAAALDERPSTVGDWSQRGKAALARREP
ncbi:hypothetical protein ACFWV1_12765 [Streptomyces sp. NPDC058700]|uniref:hypothetical protein n=1 Tax=Streptomyces sp. NPDC058700 TaxID=3346607 RepID=UPI003650005E